MSEFLLHSGERQTGTTLHKIRKDHVERYTVAASDIFRIFSGNSKNLKGLDCFCGNGYGSYILAKNLQCQIAGIDASESAINQANVHYFINGLTSYGAKKFPCAFPENEYDFITSFESIEHVEDSIGLIEGLASALKVGGYLFASVPNSEILSLEKNPNKFHYRHFSYMEFLDIIKKNGKLKLKTFYGQDTYTLSNGKISHILPENKMRLRHNYRGQFLYFILQKI